MATTLLLPHTAKHLNAATMGPYQCIMRQLYSIHVHVICNMLMKIAFLKCQSELHTCMRFDAKLVASFQDTWQLAIVELL